jgi:hypothetical protein
MDELTDILSALNKYKINVIALTTDDGADFSSLRKQLNVGILLFFVLFSGFCIFFFNNPAGHL